MKRLLLIVSIVSSVLTSCSDEPVDFSSAVGTWKLTEVNINLPNGFDINNDGVRSTNLLDEIDCPNREVLIFEPNGVMQSNLTFNPDVDIYLMDETSQTYTFSVKCDLEGTIGYATSYSQQGGVINYNNRSAIQEGNHIYMVFEKVIGVYNADGTKILGLEDLNLVFSRQ